MRKILEKCPSCEGQLAVTRMSCTECDTVVVSRYQPCFFCKLPEDSLEFLGVFVKKRGNVKEMERELGESYWTIRNRINDLIVEIGFEVESEVSEATGGSLRRRDILSQLDRGEITAAEATEMLAKLDLPDPELAQE